MIEDCNSSEGSGRSSLPCHPKLDVSKQFSSGITRKLFRKIHFRTNKYGFGNENRMHFFNKHQKRQNSVISLMIFYVQKDNS